MFKSWRQLGYGALLGSTIGASGCMGFGHGMACPTCEPACGNTCSTECGDACQPECGPTCGHCGHCGWLRGRLHGCCGWLHCGCLGTGWLHRRSGAILETLPLGKVNEAWYYEMQTNAEAVDFIVYQLDFVGQTAELTSDGKDHVLEIASRMRSAPFPVVIERTPNNADPELDVARRNLIVQVLCDLGNQDAAQRVVIATSYGPGYDSMQAQRMYYRHIQGGFGGYGGGGFGQFGGGGVGYGY
jgi:hypothetical protein